MLFRSQEHASATDQANQSGRGEASRPAINLWRVYRFDAIPATSSQDQPVRPTSPSAASDATSLSSPTVNTEATLTPGTASTSTTPPASPRPVSDSEPSASRPTSFDLPPGFVVPVIVVGLQSVDAPNQDDGEDEGPVPEGVPPPDAVPSIDPASTAAGTGTTGRSRGRTWHSRAANALRTLRSGRRGSSRGRQAAENSGSRTFLIYVIGGEWRQL